MQLIIFDHSGSLFAAYFFMSPLIVFILYFVLKGRRKEKVSFELSKKKQIENLTILLIVCLNGISLYCSGNLLYSTLPFIFILITLLIISKKKKKLFELSISVSMRSVFLGILSIMYVALIYWWLFGSIFYKLEFSDTGEKIYLGYCVPERKVSLDISKVNEVIIKNGEFPQYPLEKQIVISTVSGEVYRSRSFSRFKKSKIQEELAPLLKTISIERQKN